MGKNKGKSKSQQTQQSKRKRINKSNDERNNGNVDTASTSTTQSIATKSTEYNVRPGTTNKGPEYELKMAALMALRCAHPKVEAATMAFNAENCSDFDDLVIYRKMQQQKGKVYLVQLKYQNEPKPIKLCEFTITKENKPEITKKK